MIAYTIPVWKAFSSGYYSVKWVDSCKQIFTFRMITAAKRRKYSVWILRSRTWDIHDLGIFYDIHHIYINCWFPVYRCSVIFYVSSLCVDSTRDRKTTLRDYCVAWKCILWEYINRVLDPVAENNFILLLWFSILHPYASSWINPISLSVSLLCTTKEIWSVTV